jgi:tight adherence protein B
MIPFLCIVAILASTATFLCLRLLVRRQEKAVLARIMEKSEPRQARRPKSDRESLLGSESNNRGPVARLLLDHLHLRTSMERLVETAGLKWGAVGIAHRCAAMFLATFAILYLITGTNHVVQSAAMAALVGALPVVYVQRKARLRIAQFEAQFPDCLQFISRSMRAGHAFSAALGLVQNEFGPPLGPEFRRVFEEQNLGHSFDMVLQRLAIRMPSPDVRFFVSAVLLHKRTGGNLAELLDKLGATMRERFKLRGHVKTLSAQGLMSGRVLSAIPALVAGLMLLVNRDYILFFIRDPLGNKLLTTCIVMQIIGYLIIKKLVRIEI